LAKLVDRGQRVPDCQRGELIESAVEEQIVADH